MLRGRLVLVLLVTAIALCMVTAISVSAAGGKHGGTMVYMSGKIPSLNPLHGQWNVGFVSTNIFCSLTRLDENNHPSPYLADSYSISDDGLTYKFNLAKNAKFHDGKPITSADVAFSLEIAQKYHRFGKQMFGPIEKVETPDEHTIIFKLSKPHGPVLLAATTPRQLPILPKHVYGTGEFMSHPAHKKPVGSGPFILKDIKINEYLILERNKDHFFKDTPYLDKVIMRIVTDKTAMRVGLTRNQFQLANVTQTGRFKDIASFKKIPHLSVGKKVSPSGSQIHMEFNNRKPPLNKLEVRQAIAHAINRDHISNVLHFGYTKPAVGPMPYTNIFFDQKVKGYALDLDKANQLLDQAGYPRKDNGIRFELRLLYIAPPYLPDYQIVPAEYITAALKKVGIKVIQEPMPGAAAWSKRMADWNFDASLTNPGDKVDPAIGIGRLYVTDNIRHQAYTNTSGYSNKKVDELFAMGAKEANFDKRMSIYSNVQKLLVDEIPMLWLFDNKSMAYHHKDLFYPSYGYTEFFDEIYWKKPQK